jgi:DNA-binding beta-propeller fold protein YncE
MQASNFCSLKSCCTILFSTVSVFALGSDPQTVYPLDVRVAQDGTKYVVDLDLPGVFKIDREGKSSLFQLGTKFLRKPLNRPRCLAIGPNGEVLVGDSSTREVYLLQPGSDPKPLTDGNVGICNGLAILGDQVYAADLETRFVLRFPLVGGKPEIFAKVNTRGLLAAPDGKLWGVTQIEQQLVIFEESGKFAPVVSERIFEFPHNVAVFENGDAYVTDNYKQGIWKIPSGGKPEIFVSGEPLNRPVGIAREGEDLIVADPHAKKVFRLKLANKEWTTIFE